MTPNQKEALKDLLMATEIAWKEAPCLRMPGPPCFEADVQQCCLCELWDAFSTYKEVTTGLAGGPVAEFFGGQPC